MVLKGPEGLIPKGLAYTRAKVFAIVFAMTALASKLVGAVTQNKTRRPLTLRDPLSNQCCLTGVWATVCLVLLCLPKGSAVQSEADFVNF